MAEETRTTPQSVIDFNLSDAGKVNRSFVMKAVKGPASFPASCHADIYSSNLESFSASYNNSFYFKDCIFKGTQNGVFSLKNVSFIAENCSFESTVNLDNCKAELIACNIKQTLTTQNYTFLKSTKSTWIPSSDEFNKTSLINKDNSRVELNQDTLQDWEELLWTLDKGSLLKANNCIFTNKAGIAKVDNKSVVIIWNTKNIKNTSSSDKAIFIFDNASRLEIYNSDLIESQKILFDFKNKSKIICRNIKNVHSLKENTFNFDNSYLDLNNITNMSCDENDKNVFNLTGNTKLSLYNFTSVVSAGRAINCDKTTNLTIIGNILNSYIKSNNNIAIQAIGSNNIFEPKIKLFIKDLNNIASSVSTGMDLQNVDLTLNNISLINGDSGVGIRASGGSVIKGINVEQIWGKNEGVNLTNSYASFIQSRLIQSKDAGSPAITATNNSRFIGKNIKEILGTGSGINVDQNSSCILKGTDSLAGSNEDGVVLGFGSRFFGGSIVNIKGKNGINCTGKNSEVFLKTVQSVEGTQENGIKLIDCNLTIDNSGLSDNMSIIKGSQKGISAISSKSSSFNCNLIGPIEVNGSTNSINISGYNFVDVGIKYVGPTSISNCKTDLNSSSHDKDITISKSLVNSFANIFSGNNVNISDQSVINSFLTSFTGSNFSINKSVVNAHNSIISPASLANASLNTIRSSLKDVSLENSFLGLFGSTLNGNVTPIGKSGILGSGINMIGNVTFSTGDADLVNPVSILTAGSGNLGLQADTDIFLEGLNVKFGTETAPIRSSFLGYFTDAITLDAQNIITITSETKSIQLTATEEVRTVVGSTTWLVQPNAVNWISDDILLTATASIVLTAPTITLNGSTAVNI